MLSLPYVLFCSLFASPPPLMDRKVSYFLWRSCRQEMRVALCTFTQELVWQRRRKHKWVWQQLSCCHILPMPPFYMALPTKYLASLSTTTWEHQVSNKKPAEGILHSSCYQIRPAVLITCSVWPSSSWCWWHHPSLLMSSSHCVRARPDHLNCHHWRELSTKLLRHSCQDLLSVSMCGSVDFSLAPRLEERPATSLVQALVHILSHCLKWSRITLPC